MTDEALVLACRRGEAMAWEALVMRYQRLIYAIPRRAGLDEEQAAEVFQRVFMRLLEKLDSIEYPDRIKAWLVTTARNETWHIERRERGIGTLDTTTADDMAGEMPAADPLPDEVLLRIERQHQVRTAVEALDARCRTLLTMLFYESDPPAYADVAATLGMSEGSVGPTRARCLQKLRDRLEAAGFFRT